VAYHKAEQNRLYGGNASDSFAEESAFRDLQRIKDLSNTMMDIRLRYINCHQEDHLHHLITLAEEQVHKELSAITSLYGKLEELLIKLSEGEEHNQLEPCVQCAVRAKFGIKGCCHE
jgi:hypothetical protein